MGIAKHVQRLEAYRPGEQPKPGGGIVKLNTNENPYPPSPKCRAALAGFDATSLRRYPNPASDALRAEIARLFGAKPENVFVGNGSDEVLSIAARAFVDDGESIASLDPSYSLYKTLAAIRNVKWTGADPRDGAKAMRSLARAKSSLFLWTNPNAPTGEFAEPAEIGAFARAFRGIVIVDEAYADFARGNCMSLATRPGNRNLLVMRTFSKSYSLAGLRVGYCVGPANLVAAMHKVKDSYNVDAVAQRVALAALRDQAWMRRNAGRIAAERDRFAAKLAGMGWDVLPSEANFIFAKPPRAAAAEVFARLREQRIYVRYFPGARTGKRLRITIGTPAQMRRLLSALKSMET